MNTNDVNRLAEEIWQRDEASSGVGMPMSSSWFYFWFTNPPAALAGRSGLTG